MEQPPLPQLPPVSVSFEGGVLRATDFGDLYYSAEDGLAESRHVFLEGTAFCQPDKSHHLTIAETGFGTGLNLLTLCQAIAAQNSQCQIDYISFEAAPLDAKDAMRAHRPFRNWPNYHNPLSGNGRAAGTGCIDYPCWTGKCGYSCIMDRQKQACRACPLLPISGFWTGLLRPKTPSFGRHLSVMKLPVIPEKGAAALLVLPVRYANTGRGRF